jgi:hypothetical protein
MKMENEQVTFELQRADQMFKNPVMVKQPNGGFKKIGYARGLTSIDVSKHPSEVVYEPLYYPNKRFVVDDPLLVEFLKNQQSFTETPEDGRLWIYNPEKIAKTQNGYRRIYVDAMNYIDSLSKEELQIKAFDKVGVEIIDKTEEEIKDALYSIAEEDPQEILNLKENSPFDFIGKAIVRKVIELVRSNFYIYGERHNLLFETPNGLNAKERFADFLTTTEGKRIHTLILSKMPDYDVNLVVQDDDLLSVKGIGYGLEKALREAGINTISEFVKYDKDTITSKLYNEAGYVIPKVINIQQILDTASKLRPELSIVK